MASKSVNCSVPLAPAVLVNSGCQLVAAFRLVVASIRQVLLDGVLKPNRKPLLLANKLVKTGGGVTIIAKLLVADSGGMLLSVTLTETWLSPGNAAVFVQVSTPAVLIETLVDGDGKLKVNTESGR